MSRLRDLPWFLALARLEDNSPPLRLHARGPWTAPDGSGSLLGSPAYSRGFVRWLNRRDRPLAAAIASLWGAPVRFGLPRISETLSAVARSDDLEAAISTLAGSWPSMADPVIAHAHVADALDRLRTVWCREQRRAAKSAQKGERDVLHGR